MTFHNPNRIKSAPKRNFTPGPLPKEDHSQALLAPLDAVTQGRGSLQSASDVSELERLIREGLLNKNLKYGRELATLYLEDKHPR